MATNTEKILTEALGLSQTARAYLAEKLIESLDSEQPAGLSEAWREVVRGRCREIDTEAVEPPFLPSSASSLYRPFSPLKVRFKRF